MVIRAEIDSRLLIRLNQSASMLPTVGRMTWRLSSRNCTYGEPSPPSVSPFHTPAHTHTHNARARTRTRSPWTCFTDRQIIKHMHCPLARPVGIAAHQPCITAGSHYGHTRRIVRIAPPPTKTNAAHGRIRDTLLPPTGFITPLILILNVPHLSVGKVRSQAFEIFLL